MTVGSGNVSRLKRVARPVLRLLLVIAISFVTAEVALRIYNHFDPLPIFYDYSYNRFRGKPFAQTPGFRLNSKGFKDVEYQKEKKDRTFRILGIGDSFTYGVVPYENNYLTLVEEKLKQQGASVELINMGIPSIGPREYLSLFVNEGVELKPDLVVVSFFMGNDFTDDFETKRKPYTYSYVASLIYYLYSAHTKYEGLSRYTLVYHDDQPTFTDEAYLSLEKGRSQIFLKQNQVFGAELDDATSYLIKMKSICDTQNISLVILLIPDELQVSRALQTRVLQGLALNPEAVDFSLPNRTLIERLKQNGIDSIDLLEEFQSAAEQKNLYRPNDSHWNIEGNKLASEILVKHLYSRLRPN
jgi:hypothetical protein